MAVRSLLGLQLFRDRLMALLADFADHGLYPSLIARWMGCDHCHSLSLPAGSRGGVTMASTLLFLEGGGSLLEKWRSVIIVTPLSLPEGRREEATMASTLLFLGSGGLLHFSSCEVDEV